MARFFQLFLLPILSGALLALALQYLLPSATESNMLGVIRPPMSKAQAAALQKMPPQQATLVSRLQVAYSAVAERVFAKSNEPTTHLLNQPVAILESNSSNWVQLPRGTPVQLLSAEGAFVQVRHARSIVTMPRSVLIAGVARLH